MKDLDKILSKIMAAAELLKECGDALGEPEPIVQPDLAEDPQHYALRAVQQQIQMQRNPHWGLQSVCEHAVQALVQSLLRYRGASLHFKDTALAVPAIEPPQVSYGQVIQALPQGIPTVKGG